MTFLTKRAREIYCGLDISVSAMYLKKKQFLTFGNSMSGQLLNATLANDLKQVRALLAEQQAHPAYLVNETGDDGVTPLMYAAFYGNHEMVYMLLEAGADVGAAEKRGWTPLLYAVRYGRFEVAEMLIAAGSDVNAQTEEGQTPLLIAAKYGHPEVIRVLLENGAEPAHRDHQGRSAMDLAQEEGRPRAIDVLKTIAGRH